MYKSISVIKTHCKPKKIKKNSCKKKKTNECKIYKKGMYIIFMFNIAFGQCIRIKKKNKCIISQITRMYKK